MMKSFKPILFALNNNPESQQPMIDFLISQGLEYEGETDVNEYGFSRTHIFKKGNFKLQIMWMRNISTIQVQPDGWNGAFTEVLFDDIRETMTGYCDHNSLAFCYEGYEMLKLAIPK